MAKGSWGTLESLFRWLLCLQVDLVSNKEKADVIRVIKASSTASAVPFQVTVDNSMVL